MYKNTETLANEPISSKIDISSKVNQLGSDLESLLTASSILRERLSAHLMKFSGKEVPLTRDRIEKADRSPGGFLGKLEDVLDDIIEENYTSRRILDKLEEDL